MIYLVLQDLLEARVIADIDDILINTETDKEHVQLVQRRYNGWGIKALRV